MIAEEPIFQGRFHYVRGHPDHPTVPGSLTSRVVLSQVGLAYERKGFWGSAWEQVFFIRLDEIISARTVVDGRSGLEWYGDDYYVDIDVASTSVQYFVRLKAVGSTQEKDAFLLSNVLRFLATERRRSEQGRVAS